MANQIGERSSRHRSRDRLTTATIREGSQRAHRAAASDCYGLGGCLAAKEEYMSSQPAPAFPLDGASRDVLNEALLDSDLASFVVDAATRTAVVGFYTTTIWPEGGL